MIHMTVRATMLSFHSKHILGLLFSGQGLPEQTALYDLSPLWKSGRNVAAVLHHEQITVPPPPTPVITFQRISQSKGPGPGPRWTELVPKISSQLAIYWLSNAHLTMKVMWGWSMTDQEITTKGPNCCFGHTHTLPVWKGLGTKRSVKGAGESYWSSGLHS